MTTTTATIAYRESLLDRMIRLYGFEHENVIVFASMVDKYLDSADWNNAMRLIVEAHEKYPQIEEEQGESPFLFVLVLEASNLGGPAS